MKYRKLDADGDMTLGHGEADYHIDTPAGVAQAVVTRLRLLAGEWFLDLAEGTPYDPAVLGKHTAETYGPVLRRRILKTEGVISLEYFEMIFDGDSRKITVIATADTVYGQTEIRGIL